MSQAPDYEVRFSPHPAGLKVNVRGAGTLVNTIAYWQAIVAQLKRRPVRGVLLVDEMQGESLQAQEWHDLVQSMRGTGLDRVRIAHVKPGGLQRIEYCEIYAVEAGIDARVFVNEVEAGVWLRHAAR
jgi:hypothetical protein